MTREPKVHKGFTRTRVITTLWREVVSMIVTLSGGGSIYKIYDAHNEAEGKGTVAPAFSRTRDVETWRSLNGKEFKEITIVLKDE